MKKIFIPFLGKFTWEKPSWISAFKSLWKKNQKKSWSILSGIVFIVILAATGYWYYQKMPKPEILSAHFYLPSIVIKEQKQTIQPLQIVFDYTSPSSAIVPDEENNGSIPEENYISVAPLNQVGKTISQGIEISPPISGQWQWQSDKVLIFTPDTPWPAGTQYSVRFSKSLFEQNAKKYRMSPWNAKFTTTALSITISDFRFFQDVDQPQLYKTSATLNFNYPIDNDSLSSNTKLVYPVDKKQVPYKISYNTESLEAYIQADISELPNNPQHLQLNIDKNVKPGGSGNPTTAPISSNVMIPDKNSIMKINKIDAAIVTNDNGQPDQVLTIDTEAVTTAEDLKKFIHVYLLPSDYPATSDAEAIKNYQWNTTGEVSKNWLTEKIELTAIPTEHDYETLHSFKIHVKPGRYLYVAIDSGLPSYNNSYTLANSYATIVKTPHYPKEINFLHPGSLLTLTGEKKVSVIVRGFPAVKFTIARVLPGEINHLITQTRGDFQNPEFIHNSFNSSNISIISSKIETFDNSDPSKAQYLALDLTKYLNQQPFKLGLFLLKAEGYTPKDKTIAAKDSTDDSADNNNDSNDNSSEDNSDDSNNTGNSSINRLILITDNDMLVKNNADGSHDVFTHSMTEGNPVSNAQVSVLSKNGVALMTQNTDNNGHAVFPTLKDFKDDKEPTVYMVTKGNDVSFMPYDRYDRSLNYSRFDTGGDTNTYKYGLNAFLFSDRGIYRPGEEMHLGMIVKGVFAANTIPDIPLELIITDSRGMSIYDKKLSSNITGLLSESYTPDKTAPSGTYTAALYVTKDGSTDNLLGTTSFQVQDFEPDQLKITAKFNPAPSVVDGWISPQNLKAQVGLWNLFGTPAINHRISATLYFAPQKLQFSAYPDTIFNDPYRDLSKPAKIFSETLNDSQTDDKGFTQFNLDLSRYAQSTYQLTLLTRGFAADGGRGVSKTASVLVSPLKYLIGYKTANNLNYIQKNLKANIQLIAINPELKKIEVKDLKVKLIKLTSISTLVKQSDGSYQYQNVIGEHQISDTPLIISASGNDYALPTNQAGDFKLQITNSEGLLLSEVGFSIIADALHAVGKDSTLQLKLNKHSFSPGENLQLNITAPYTGSGLITIERDKVYTYKWFKMNSTSKIESITIPTDFEGTGYVNVALIRDWNSDEIFMNPLSFSVQDFSVIPDTRNMKIKLDVPDRAYPGKALNIKYSSGKPGNIIIYAIDEGILQVADYQTPDPLAYYFQKQALSVNTAQIADQILPKYIAKRELSAVGGDEKQKSIASNLNPFARKVAPVVYWSGIINTESTVNSVTYQVPDYFNGTLRIMAVAVSPQAVGATSRKIQVRDDLVLTPNVPTFIAPNDQFEVSVNIANTTNSDSQVKLQIKPSPFIEVQGSSTASISVPANNEKTTIFKLKALNTLGETYIAFNMQALNKTFAQKVSLSLRPVTPYQTTIKSGYSTTDTSVSLSRELYPEMRKLEAISSTSPFILLKGLKNYLSIYPYNCTEQLVSTAFVGIALKNQPGYTNDSDAFDATYNKIIQMLRQRQTSKGDFNYWPNGREQTNDPFITIYAADFLTSAKIKKYNVPGDLFSNTIAYLKDYVSTNPSSMSDARLHAYAIYILTRNDIVTTDYIANLQAYYQQNKDWQKDISSTYLAATYKMLQNTDMANKLIGSYQLGKPSAEVDNSLYSQQIMDAEYIIILANYFPDRLRNLRDSSLMPLVSNLSNNSINSLIAATSALALSNFAQALDNNNSNANLSISATDKNNKTVVLGSDLFGPDVRKISFASKNRTAYFYQVTQAGFDNILPNADIKTGMEVYREYQNKDGATVTSVNLGDELTVHIRIRGASSQSVYNVAIVDLLPGGFEMVPNSVIAPQAATDYLDYYDVREDRIIFYVTATSDSLEYTYRIRATNRGNFAIAPIFANSMYNPQVIAQQKGGSMKVQ